MASLNEHSFERKLQSVNNTQDSIQTLSLWCVHHKAHHKKIVNLWMKVLKKSKATQRLNLFYLCNDVVQHSKRKGASVFIDSFATVMEEAATLAREPSIRPNILRIFNIWEERGVFESEFIEKIKADVVSSKVRIKASTKFLAEFKPHRVTEGIEKFTRLEGEVELKQKQLLNSKVDVTNTEALRQLKDRNDGKRFSQQFEEGANKLEDFIKSQEKEIEERTKLVVLLEQSEIFYEAQYSEAKIVANAYRNFGTRVSSLKKRLDELKKFLPDPSSPIPSPTIDAPSPGATPPTPPYDPSQDNVGVEDMDMSDSDDDKPSGTIIAAAPIKPGTGTSKTGARPVASRKHKVDSAKPIPPPPGLGQMPVTGMMFSSFMSGGLPSTMLSTTTTSSSSSKPTTTTATSASTSATKGSTATVVDKEEEAYTPGSSTSAPSPEGSPAELNLSPVETETIAKPSAEKRTLTPIASAPTETASKKPKYHSPVTQTFGQGSGGLDLDSRLRQVMQNTPIFPRSELFDSPGRSAQSPDISTPPMQKSAIQSQSWGNSPVSQSSLPGVLRDQHQSGSSSGGMTPSQILGMVQANTQPSAKVMPGNSDMNKGTETGTPLRDEEGTPVRDENNKSTQAAAANPIEFLSRLITSTQQAQGGASSNFLSGLSALTETMKSAMQQGKQASASDPPKETAGSLISGLVKQQNAPAMPSAIQKIPVAAPSYGSSRPAMPTPQVADQTLPNMQQEVPSPISLSQPARTVVSSSIPQHSVSQGIVQQSPAVPHQQSAPVVSPVTTQAYALQGKSVTSGVTLPVATNVQSQPITPIDGEVTYNVQAEVPQSEVAVGEQPALNVPGRSDMKQEDMLLEQQGITQNWNNATKTVTVSEPTSPIPVLGDQGKNSIPVIGQAGQSSQDLNQVGSVPSALSIAGSTNTTAVEVLGNPIPSYSQRAGQTLTGKVPPISPSLQPERSLKDDFSRSGALSNTRAVEVHEYGFGRPIERVHSYGIGQTIGVLQREREIAARVYERDEYARTYLRSAYDRTRDYDRSYSRSGYRGSTTSSMDRHSDNYPPYRGDSRYGGRDPYGYDYSRGGPPGRPPPPSWGADRRPYRY
ncbi:regulation of nuclear pre-mRNA domain-containing protein 2-like [Ptychodera flava]|uniref:regulation of nuclear pre-mRNA domain-containing protein 2-like n=1 Tax=Ptychodera flava TaxID=63121 RepID=UPI00396A6740